MAERTENAGKFIEAVENQDPKTKKAIAAKLGWLEEVLDNLAKEVECLRVIIKPVLRREEPQTDSADKEKETPQQSAPLADDLQGLLDRIHYIRARILDTIERCEL